MFTFHTICYPKLKKKEVTIMIPEQFKDNFFIKIIAVFTHNLKIGSLKQVL